MNSWKVAKSPERLPRSRSQALGGEETLTKTICLPPTMISRSGLRGVMVKLRRRLGQHLHHEVLVHADVGAVRPCSRPACRISTASGLRNSMPISLQDAHRAAVDRHHPIGIERFGRTVGVDRDAPGHLVDDGGAGAGLVARAPACTFPSSQIVCHRGLLSFRTDDSSLARPGFQLPTRLRRFWTQAEVSSSI